MSVLLRASHYVKAVAVEASARRRSICWPSEHLLAVGASARRRSICISLASTISVIVKEGEIAALRGRRRWAGIPHVNVRPARSVTRWADDGCL